MTAVLWLAMPLVVAQETAQTIQKIDEQLAALPDREGLEEQDRTRATELLTEARRELTRTTEMTQTVDAYIEATANASAIIAQINRDTAGAGEPDTLSDLPDTSDDLRSRLNFLQSERTVQTRERAELLNERANLASRASSIAEDAAAVRATLSDLLEARVSDEALGESIVDQARQTLIEARTSARRSELIDLQRELQTIPQRQTIVSARITRADSKIATLDVEIALILQRLSDVRMDRADAELERARAARSAASDLPAPIMVLAEENVQLASELKAMADEALVIEEDIKTLSQQTLLIRQQAETVERILATGRVTEEAGALLRQLRSSLPKAQDLRVSINDAVESRASTQLDLILWQDRLRSNRQMPIFAAPIEIIDTADDADREIETVVDLQPEMLINDRQRLLSELIDAGQAQSDRLTQKEIRVSETLSESQGLTNTLDRRLLWLPSNIRPLRSWVGNIVSGFRWGLSPDVLRGAWDDYRSLMANRITLLILVTAFIVFLGRSSLLAALDRLNDAVGKVARDKYLTTPLAIGACLMLALPMPALLFGVSFPVIMEGSSSALLTSLATGLLALATILFLVLFMLSLSRPEGVLATHFNWNMRALRAVRRSPSGFISLFCFAVFLFVASMASQRPDVQHGVGMAAFVAASVIFAAYGYGIFDFERGLLRRVVKEGLSTSFLLMGLLGFGVAPLVIGLLPLLGYFDTAIALQVRILQTAGLLCLAALLFGVTQRLLLIAQRRLALRKAIERRAQIAAERAEREELGEEDDDDDFVEILSPVDELEEERQRISEQTRRLLLYLIGFGSLAGLLGIWATVLPALGVANDIRLWTGVESVDGVRAARAVTLWNLVLFIVFIAAGFVAAYNIRGVLEIGPFQRLNLTPGSRYAIDTIIGYFLIGTGIVAGFLQLGVDWSKLQWIIAALGVGLGFGLQEIVANFISGLIILFERPVRVGDIVTIGELDGSVTNIAIRATTIKDFDNREVLLPNKSIITENVTNWTLRDSVLRITIDIGVAYGSDIEAVRSLLLKVAEDENDVLETPEPRAYFMSHGDSSLDFELRVFISNPRKRFRVRDELNTAINAALTETGVEIPFPQRDIHVKPT